MQFRVFTWCPTPTKSTNRRGRGSQGNVTTVYDITKRNKSTPSIVSPSKMSNKICVFFLFLFLKTHIQSECRTKNMGKVPLMVGGHAAYHSHLMAFTVFA